MEQLLVAATNRWVGFLLLPFLAIVGPCHQVRAQWDGTSEARRDGTPTGGEVPAPQGIKSPSDELGPEFGFPAAPTSPARGGSLFDFGSRDDSGRHVGLGDPLEGTSWRNRPFHIGWMWGELIGDDLVSGRVDQHTNVVGGYRIGWDVDHYWGLEGRFLFANLDFTDAADLTVSRTSQNHYWDVDFLYYPWGDSRWRPFASLGVGWASFEYRDAVGQDIEKSLFAIPWGGGVKYYWKNWMALRLSVMDNWAIGEGPLSTMHNVSLTGDVEMRFGGTRTSYYPYAGGLHLW